MQNAILKCILNTVVQTFHVRHYWKYIQSMVRNISLLQVSTNGWTVRLGIVRHETTGTARYKRTPTRPSRIIAVHRSARVR